jgi:hypothetical protein
MYFVAKAKKSWAFGRIRPEPGGSRDVLRMGKELLVSLNPQTQRHNSPKQIADGIRQHFSYLRRTHRSIYHFVPPFI